MGTPNFRWGRHRPYEVETDETFSLRDLLQELGRLELTALGCVKLGEVPLSTAEVQQAMARIKAVLQAAKPELPTGHDPLTVSGWHELREVWGAYHQLRRYFSLTDPPPADDAPGDIDPHDPTHTPKALLLPLLWAGPPVLAASDRGSRGPMLLHHLGTTHPAEAGAYLERMQTEDIPMVAAEAYVVIEDT
jgi:hypothetical protein